MSKKTIKELQTIARLSTNAAIKILLDNLPRILKSQKAMPLKDFLPSDIWTKFNQAQKGFIGKVFNEIHRDLGFEFAYMGYSKTTCFYRYVNHQD